MGFLLNLANVWKDDHPTALFICLMDKPLRWPCQIEADRIERDPNTVISTPACWSVDTNHLHGSSPFPTILGAGPKNFRSE